MNTESTVASRSDEVVFDNRNKSYGAYSIRRSYTSSLTKGSSGSLLVAGLFMAIAQGILMMKTEIHKIIADPPFHDIMPVPDIIRNPQPPKESHHRPTPKTNLPPQVVSTTPTVDPPPVDMQQSSTSNSNDDTGTPTANLDRSGTAPGPVAFVPEPPKTVDIAEVMPEFEGGAKAMYKFLRKHLRYPHTDQHGTVFVRFIIDVTGTVTGVEVIRGVSGQLDKEASRVITLMPKWKPGSQHGTPVNVRMVLPIKFEMERE